MRRAGLEIAIMEVVCWIECVAGQCHLCWYLAPIPTKSCLSGLLPVGLEGCFFGDALLVMSGWHLVEELLASDILCLCPGLFLFMVTRLS
jgi:hypothetical protein